VSRKLLVGLLLVTGGIVGGVLGLTDSTPAASLSVWQFLKGARGNDTVRVRGELVAGSLCLVEEPCGYRFRVRDIGTPNGTDGTSRPELHVRYDTCVTTDSFRERWGVPVELTLDGAQCRTCRYFEATQVLVRSAWKYEVYRDAQRAPPFRVPVCQP
jgi:hypothetical protein